MNAIKRYFDNQFDRGDFVRAALRQVAPGGKILGPRLRGDDGKRTQRPD